MRKRTLIPLLLTLLLGCLVFLLWCAEPTVPTELIALLAKNGDVEEEITGWLDDQGNVYVCVPGYVDFANSRMILRQNAKVRIDDQMVETGQACSMFQLNKTYTLSYVDCGDEKKVAITFIQSGGVPTMFIDTQTGSMERIHMNPENAETGKIRLYSETGKVCHVGEIEKISGRGNYTWKEFDKKPYSITLEKDAALLGMGAAQKWILLANASDPSHMRNKIVYDFATKIGLPYSPDSRWVDLYLNGQYAGLYQLCERNEVHPERVALAEADTILLSIEDETRMISMNIPYVKTASGTAYRIHAPVNANEYDKNRILNELESLENGILQIDDEAALENVIDVDSWALKYIVDDIFANSDAGARSHFIYFLQGKAYAGPVWDYDLSMGNRNAWQFESPRAYLTERLVVSDGFYCKLYHALSQNSVFMNRVAEIYETEIVPLMEELITEQVDCYAIQVLQAGAADQHRWNVSQDVMGEVDKIRKFLQERVVFRSSIWLEKKDYQFVRADPRNGSYYAYYAVTPGDRLTDLPELAGNEDIAFTGWYEVETGERYDSSLPVVSNLQLYAGWENQLGHKIEQVVKVLPVGMLVLAFILLVYWDVRNIRRTGEKSGVR